jgi:hypothetical protein
MSRMESPNSKNDAPSLQATVKRAVEAMSPLLKEAMDDVVHPWQRVLTEQGDSKDFVIVGGEVAAVAALVVPKGIRALASWGEHAAQTKTLEEQWLTAEHLPFFDKPLTPPSVELTKTFDKVQPSIGVVGTTKTVGEGDAAQTWFSLGAGFMVDDEGLFLTSHHEIDGKDAVSVFLSRENHYEVKLLGVDKEKDLALMRVVQSSDDDVFHPLPLSDKPIEPGDEAMAVGIHNGIKVATGRFLGTKEFGPSQVFDLKAPGGFSGGPIVNKAGEAVSMSLQSANRFQKFPFSQFLTRQFGGDKVYGASSEDLRTFIKNNRLQPGKYLQRLDSNLTD